MDMAELTSTLKSSVEHKESMEPVAFRIPKYLYKEAKVLERQGVKKSVYLRYLLKLGREALEQTTR